MKNSNKFLFEFSDKGGGFLNILNKKKNTPILRSGAFSQQIVANDSCNFHLI